MGVTLAIQRWPLTFEIIKIVEKGYWQGIVNILYLLNLQSNTGRHCDPVIRIGTGARLIPNLNLPTHLIHYLHILHINMSQYWNVHHLDVHS